MLKYLIKSTQEIRVESESDADALHKQMAAEADEIGAVLTAWTETKKERKEKGEIVEIWYNCKYTLTFNDPKSPSTTLDSIVYNLGTVYKEDSEF